MKANELAAQLHGIELGDIPGDAIEGARRGGLVMVYSPSADTIAFYGALRGQVNMFEDGTVYFDIEGPLPDVDDVPEVDRLAYYARKGLAHMISAEHERDGFTWTLSTIVPHSRFMVLNNGERYCRGIVFDIKAIGGAA